MPQFMTTPLLPELLKDQPENVQRVLSDFVSTLSETLTQSLQSVILFGSAAEGRLRPTSDVNLLIIVENCPPQTLGKLQEPLAFAATAIGLSVLIVEIAELDAVMEAFAQKFSDIVRRHRVLLGKNVLQGKQISHDAALRRTRQVLLNLTLRLRERCAMSGAKAEIALAAIRHAIGPIRTCAAQIVELEGRQPVSPKESLSQLVAGWGRPNLVYLPDYYSQLREHGAPITPTPQQALADTLEVVQALRSQTGLIT